TYYFRTKFVAPPGSGPSGALRFTHFIDDGAVFYLNGVEVNRFNIPAGDITYTTVPSQPLNTPACVMNAVTITNLLTGTNLLAVEVHQWPDSAGTSDVYFGTEVD